MSEQPSRIALTINGANKHLTVEPHEKLLDVLRRESYVSVKRGCDTGDCGVCSVLLDGWPVRSCMTLAIAARGRTITTVEGLSQDGVLHPVQQAFVETGAIQCGFCTPAQVLVAKALLEKSALPTETEIRDAMSGVLCRCTGYVSVIEAAQRAAAVLRGEKLAPVTHLERLLPKGTGTVDLPEAFYRRGADRRPLPPLVFTPAEMEPTRVVGKPEVKVDARKLVQGRPVFAGDFCLEGMLHGGLLTSPHAHARIKRIDASRARALPAV